MNKVANILVCGLVGLLILNGIRLTFFPLRSCHLVRGNQMPTIEESVMEFHKLYGTQSQNGETYGPEADTE